MNKNSRKYYGVTNGCTGMPMPFNGQLGHYVMLRTINGWIPYWKNTKTTLWSGTGETNPRQSSAFELLTTTGYWKQFKRNPFRKH